MKLEKRSAGVPEETPASQTDSSPGGKKPVIIYIMILFIVAFLLMAMSFIMHQRSNNAAMNELKTSVHALQETQATQEENIQLQNDLKAANEQKAELEKKAAALEKELEEARLAEKSSEDQLQAMNLFYTLQQQFAVEDYDGCKRTVSSMEEAGLDKLLPAETKIQGISSPAQQYLEIRETVEKK